MRILLLPCPISEASLVLKSLVAPAGLCSALELSRSWEQSCSRRTKAHLVLTSGAAPALVRAQPRALCVEAGAVHWQPWMETARGSCWSQHSAASGRILILEQGKVQESQPLNSWRLSQSRYFTSDDATIEWNNEKRYGLSVLHTHLFWKLCVVQDLSLWVLFKAVCFKTFEFVSFRTAEIIKF